MITRPTREQIETATPEQLNIWVAGMMGWQPDSQAPECWLHCDAPTLLLEFNHLPDWSGDIAAAFTLLDHVTTEGNYGHPIKWAITAGSDRASEVSIVVFRGFGTSTEYCVPTAEYDDPEDGLPAAICRAALLWWIEQP